MARTIIYRSRQRKPSKAQVVQECIDRLAPLDDTPGPRTAVRDVLDALESLRDFYEGEIVPRHIGFGLTEEQLDGLHCIYCDQPDGEMRPVYRGPRGQLFRHGECDSKRGES